MGTGKDDQSGTQERWGQTWDRFMFLASCDDCDVREDSCQLIVVGSQPSFVGSDVRVQHLSDPGQQCLQSRFQDQLFQGGQELIEAHFQSGESL